jgi:hypothetical protein
MCLSRSIRFAVRGVTNRTRACTFALSAAAHYQEQLGEVGMQRVVLQFVSGGLLLVQLSIVSFFPACDARCPPGSSALPAPAGAFTLLISTLDEVVSCDFGGT